MQPQYLMDETYLDTDSTDTKQELRVVIAYDDLDAGQRAMRVLANLGKGLGDATEFQPLPWPFELLADADWRDAAASEAVNADILIVAASGANPLPPAVGRWVKDVIGRKRGTNAAVVALFGPEEDPDGTRSSRLEDIQGASQRAGLDFFAPMPRRELDDVVTIVHQRAEMVTPVLEEILYPHRIAPRQARNA